MPKKVVIRPGQMLQDIQDVYRKQIALIKARADSELDLEAHKKLSLMTRDMLAIQGEERAIRKELRVMEGKTEEEIRQALDELRGRAKRKGDRRLLKALEGKVAVEDVDDQVERTETGPSPEVAEALGRIRRSEG